MYTLIINNKIKLDISSFKETSKAKGMTNVVCIGSQFTDEKNNKLSVSHISELLKDDVNLYAVIKDNNTDEIVWESDKYCRIAHIRYIIENDEISCSIGFDMNDNLNSEIFVNND